MVQGEASVTAANSILLEAQALVHGDRQKAYGHPIDDFSRTAAMWEAILGFPVTAEQVGLCMCAVKISRQCNLPKRDNLVDLAGYAETVNMVLEEQAQREKAAEALFGEVGKAGIDVEEWSWPDRNVLQEGP
jgi:hypothetical protein